MGVGVAVGSGTDIGFIPQFNVEHVQIKLLPFITHVISLVPSVYVPELTCVEDVGDVYVQVVKSDQDIELLFHIPTGNALLK